MSTADLDLYRKKLCRQLSQYFGHIGIQADKTLLVFNESNIVCTVSMHPWGVARDEGSADYLVTMRVPIV
jgi:hypothetical protein